MAEAEDAGGAGAAPAAAAVAGDEIRPYRIHVSKKYLDLTKQKLELTRLPHEGSEPKSVDWWEPKPQVEPLIDFWLEEYSWRDQENAFNALPQFRTSIPISPSETPLRLHFIHVRSPHAGAVPLLLIPPFPFTNLSFGHLVKPLTDPEDVANNQPFHLVVPSLPGLGFSDPLPNNTPVISTIAEMLNTSMTRLSYNYYLATNAGAASSSPAEIDWKLANHLATHYASSCLGTHLISPPLSSPRLAEAPWEWTKWTVANFFHAGILGYSDDDFAALRAQVILSSAAAGSSSAAAPIRSIGTFPRRRLPRTPTEFGLNKLGMREPNTLAYALCDSPTGLLVFVIKALRLLGPRVTFTPDQIITFAELAWLPGPEYAMRLWAYAAAYEDEEERRRHREARAAGVKPRVAITVFLGGTGGRGEEAGSGTSVGAGAGAALQGEGVAQRDAGRARQVALPPPLPNEESERYACPAWGRPHYEVVFAQRTPGRPGLLAWDRPEVIAAGVRGLAKEILKLDSRLKPSAEPPTAPLEQVVVVESKKEQGGPPDQQPAQTQQSASQEQVARPAVLAKIPEESFGHEPEGSTPLLLPAGAEQDTTGKGKEPGKEKEKEREIQEKVIQSDETLGKEIAAEPTEKEKETVEPAQDAAAQDVAAHDAAAQEAAAQEAAAQEAAAQEAAAQEKAAEVFSDEESPDTLVVQTPPLEV